MADMLPPGVTANSNSQLKHFASGGNENPWLSFDKVKHYTNAFIIQDGKVSLYNGLSC